PVTVKQVATTVGSRALLELLHALAMADGLATGPAAWNDWKATLVADLVRRVAAVLDGDPMPRPAPLREDQLALAAEGGPAATVPAPKVSLVDDASDTATVVEVRAHDAPGLLWRVGRALGECGLDVRAARVETLGAEAVDVFYVTDGEGKPLGDGDLRRTIA